MSVAGIGTDILVTSRITNILKRDSKSVARFIDRVLHPIEQTRFSKMRESNDQVRFIASTWTAKEALYKSLDPARQDVFQLKHWYRSAAGGNNQKGQSHEMISDAPQPDSEKILVSISHDGDITSAFVVRTISH